MTKEDFEKLSNSIQEKVGKDNAGLIADDLATLMTENSRLENDLFNRNNDITKLKEDKEKLTDTNIALLQQVSVGEETPTRQIKNKDDEEVKKFSFKTAFDEKGRFIR